MGYIKIISTLFLLSFCFISFSQNNFFEGVIEMNSGENIIGKIKILNSKSIEYIDNSGNKKRFSTDELKSLKFDNSIFEIDSIFIDNSYQKLIFRNVISGNLVLYEIPFAEKDKNFAISEIGKEKILITPQNSNIELRKLTYENSTDKLIRLITNIRFRYSLSSFIDFVKEFGGNNIDKIEITETKRPFFVKFGAIFGFASSQINFTGSKPNAFYSSNGKLSKSNNMPFGINLHIFTNRKVSFELEVYKNNYSGSRMYSYQSSAGTNTDKISITDNSISIPLMMRVNVLVKKNNTLYLKFGPRYVFETNLDGIVERQNFGPYDVFEYKKRNGFGYIGGIGIEKGLTDKLFVKLEYRYSNNVIQDRFTKMGQSFSNQIIVGISRQNKKFK